MLFPLTYDGVNLDPEQIVPAERNWRWKEYYTGTCTNGWTKKSDFKDLDSHTL
jgi:hypothetical protein